MESQKLFMPHSHASLQRGLLAPRIAQIYWETPPAQSHAYTTQLNWFWQYGSTLINHGIWSSHHGLKAHSCTQQHQHNEDSQSITKMHESTSQMACSLQQYWQHSGVPRTLIALSKTCKLKEANRTLFTPTNWLVKSAFYCTIARIGIQVE